MAIQKLIVAIILAAYAVELDIKLQTVPIHEMPPKNVPSVLKIILQTIKDVQSIDICNVLHL
jgi:hypothetical protein